jgi:hypothetical protein
VLLGAAVAWLPYPQAHRAWAVLALACLGIGGGLVLRVLGARLSAWAVRPRFACCASIP